MFVKIGCFTIQFTEGLPEILKIVGITESGKPDDFLFVVSDLPKICRL